MGRKILFVDSDKDFLKTMCQYLSWYDLEINTLSSSSEVLGCLEKEMYDLLICDVFVQPVDAFSIIEDIRQLQKTQLKDIHILLMAPEQVNYTQYVFMQKYNIFFITKYRGAEVWYEKISSILL